MNTQVPPEECLSHLDYAGSQCPGCDLPVDEHGNTERDFRYCAFPHCGCDGARLCMAKEGASEDSLDGNVEGMWSGKTKRQREAVFNLVDRVNKETSDGK